MLHPELPSNKIIRENITPNSKLPCISAHFPPRKVSEILHRQMQGGEKIPK